MNVGDYVKTKSGGIGKIIKIDNNASCSHIITDNETFGLGWDGEKVNWDFITEIVKSSPNIIDLIEAGDYVNGKEVTNYYYVGEQKVLCLNYAEPYEESDDIVSNFGIKTIVTKEQFKSMEYEV